MNLDATLSFGQLAFGACLAVVYAGRAVTRGAARFARVDKNGSSALLGKGPMQMAYWALQPVARLAVRAGVTANAVTYASLALGIAAGVAIAAGHLGVAAALSTVSALGDALDGLVARLTNTASNAGETLDAAVDRYNELAFVGGLAVYVRTSLPLLVLALLALGASFMVSYSTAKAEALGVEPPRGAMRRTERAVYLNLGVGLVPLVAMAYPGHPAYADVPAILAMGLVATVGNVSAVRRLLAIAAAVEIRDRALLAGDAMLGARERELDSVHADLSVDELDDAAPSGRYRQAHAAHLDNHDVDAELDGASLEGSSLALASRNS